MSGHETIDFFASMSEEDPIVHLWAIVQVMAETFYGVPYELKAECQNWLPEDQLKVLRRFEAHCTTK